jgi:hypothetical protein
MVQMPSKRDPGGELSTATVRSIPYPYKAALAICSDIDWTKTAERFLAIQEFLNTEADTRMGQGLGLEIGNSFFCHTPDDSFAFFSNRPRDRELIETFIKAGYLDCLHSFGDGAQTRKDALKALEALQACGCRVDVWVDHSQAPSNLGKDTTCGMGDVPDSPSYHADATLAYGIKYVWKGRCSAIIGQGVPFRTDSFRAIYDPAHPGFALLNVLREASKTALGYFGIERFALHRHNRLMRVAALRDGQKVFEFQRCNSYWRGPAHGHDSLGLEYGLRPQALQVLVASGGMSIIYTHLGKGPAVPPYIPPKTVSALRRLAEQHRSGNILVTTTSRLLRYHRMQSYLRWCSEMRSDQTMEIRIQGIDDPIHGWQIPSLQALQGLTFYVPKCRQLRMYLDGQELNELKECPADETGQKSVMIPWNKLNYHL